MVMVHFVCHSKCERKRWALTASCSVTYCMSNSFLFVCYWHSHFHKNVAVLLWALNTQLRFVFAMMEDFMAAILFGKDNSLQSVNQRYNVSIVHTLSRVCFIAFDPSHLKTFFFLVPMNIAFFFQSHWVISIGQTSNNQRNATSNNHQKVPFESVDHSIMLIESAFILWRFFDYQLRNMRRKIDIFFAVDLMWCVSRENWLNLWSAFLFEHSFIYEVDFIDVIYFI